MAVLQVTTLGGTTVEGGQLKFFNAADPGGNAPPVGNQHVAAVAVDAPVGNHMAAYSRGIAELLSKVAGWSYSDLETFERQLVSLELHGETVLAGGKFTEIEVTNDAMFVGATAQVIVTADGLAAIVSFRGTEVTNVNSLLTDAGTKKVEFVEGLPVRVHQGFKLSFKALWYGYQGVLDVLMSEPNQNLQAIYITGHSLGGACAFLAGLALEHQNIQLWGLVRGIYTYGQPMVVDDRDRSTCETRIGARLFRHIYFNDIVPHLPPLSVGAFDHVGAEYNYDSNHGWGPRTDWPWVPMFKRRATQVFLLVGTLPFIGYDFVAQNIQWNIFKSPWSIADHTPVGYMEYW
jgi:hypothetical protein